MKKVYKIAGLNILIEYFYNETSILLDKFRIDDFSHIDFEILITESDVSKQMELTKINEPSFVENQCILDKLSSILLNKYGSFIFHGSAISYKDNGYIFTAPSGTGKSTHVNNLRKVLGDEIKYINDDKPIIKIEDNTPFIYGSPWEGKHFLGSNIKAKLKAFIFLEQDNKNSVKEVDFNEFLTKILSQSQKPKTVFEGEKLLDVIVNFTNSNVKFYILKCNKDVSSANCTIDNVFKG